jgi:hypothetical protein
MAVRNEGIDATPQNNAPDNTLLAFARDHFALFTPVIGALIFAIRCIIVSEGDPYVAFILATETSVGDAIRVLLFTVIPILLFLLSYATAFPAARRIYNGSWRNLKTLAMGVASVTLFYGSWHLYVGFQTPVDTVSLLLLMVLYLVVLVPGFILANASEERLRQKRRRERQLRKGRPWRARQYSNLRKIVMWAEQAMTVLLMAVLAGGLAIAALWILLIPLADKTFWLPSERLAFQGQAPFTGYVLKVSEDHLVILNDTPRIIIEKPKKDLVDRDFCYPKDHKAQSSKVAKDSPVCPGYE